MLTSKQRAWLRSQANHLRAPLQIGKDGFSDAIVRHADDLLRTRELVKITVLKTGDVPAYEVAEQLAASLKAEVVQVMGRKVTLYRHSKQLAEKGQALILPR